MTRVTMPVPVMPQSAMSRPADPAVGAAAPTGTGRSNERQRLQEVCAEFEAFFLREILKGLKTTASPTGILASGSAGADIQAGIADDQFALWLANSGGMGLGKVLYESLVKQTGDDPL